MSNVCVRVHVMYSTTFVVSYVHVHILHVLYCTYLIYVLYVCHVHMTYTCTYNMYYMVFHFDDQYTSQSHYSSSSFTTAVQSLVGCCTQQIKRKEKLQSMKHF